MQQTARCPPSSPPTPRITPTKASTATAGESSQYPRCGGDHCMLAGIEAWSRCPGVGVANPTGFGRSTHLCTSLPSGTTPRARRDSSRATAGVRAPRLRSTSRTLGPKPTTSPATWPCLCTKKHLLQSLGPGPPPPPAPPSALARPGRGHGGADAPRPPGRRRRRRVWLHHLRVSGV